MFQDKDNSFQKCETHSKNNKMKYTKDQMPVAKTIDGKLEK